MKKLVLSLCFISGALIANISPPPYRSAFEGEFLYWSPSLGPNNYWAQFTSPTGSDNTRNIANTPDFRSGFRLNSLYAFDPCNVIEARFTFFDGGHTSSASASAADDLTVFPYLFASVGTASSHVNFRYYAGDLDLQNASYSWGGFEANLFEGLHYTWMRVQTLITSATAPVGGTANIRSRFWGVGPEIGANLRYHLPFPVVRSLSLVGNFRGALLVSNAHYVSDMSGSDFGTATTAHIFGDPIWEVVPAFDFKLGLDWFCKFSCLMTHVEIGYEFLSYHNAYLFQALAGHLNPTEKGDISFQGPYAALGVKF